MNAVIAVFVFVAVFVVVYYVGMRIVRGVERMAYAAELAAELEETRE